jgi:hypothetical protein
VRRIRLLSSNAPEAATILNKLRGTKFQVEYDEKFRPALFRAWREDPPWAFVIDLSRLPSQGREIAVALRQSPRTRTIPVVFVNGEVDKVKAIRSVLPDAKYCTTETLVETLETAQPLPNAVTPAAMMERYASRTAVQKLGITEKSRVVLIDPPRNATVMLGNLPRGAQFVEEDGEVTLCFAHSVDELRATMSSLRRVAAKKKLWILWRKRTAPGHVGITEPLIRETGRDLGLVDYKICSVDKSWSAMLFASKKG